MACIELYATGQKLSITLKGKDLATSGFQKHFPAHLWVREFWPQIYSL